MSHTDRAFIKAYARELTEEGALSTPEEEPVRVVPPQELPASFGEPLYLSVERTYDTTHLYRADQPGGEHPASPASIPLPEVDSAPQWDPKPHAAPHADHHLEPPLSQPPEQESVAQPLPPADWIPFSETAANYSAETPASAPSAPQPQAADPQTTTPQAADPQPTASAVEEPELVISEHDLPIKMPQASDSELPEILITDQPKDERFVPQTFFVRNAVAASNQIAAQDESEDERSQSQKAADLADIAAATFSLRTVDAAIESAPQEKGAKPEIFIETPAARAPVTNPPAAKTQGEPPIDKLIEQQIAQTIEETIKQKIEQKVEQKLEQQITPPAPQAETVVEEPQIQPPPVEEAKAEPPKAEEQAVVEPEPQPEIQPEIQPEPQPESAPTANPAVEAEADEEDRAILSMDSVGEAQADAEPSAPAPPQEMQRAADPFIASWEVDGFAWPAIADEFFPADFDAPQEGLKQLLASIDSNIVMIAGAAPRAGSTSLSMALAKRLANEDAQVLLVDFNTEAPALAESLGLPAPCCWVQIIKEGVSLEEAAISSVAETLTLIALRDASGVALPYAEFFQRLAKTAAHFDYVIIDCGAADALADILQATPSVTPSGAALLVSDARQADQEGVAAAMERLEGVGIVQTAVVENFAS